MEHTSRPTRNVLYSKFPENYRPYGSYDSGNAGQTTPLAVQLGDDNLLVNGAGFWYPVQGYQMGILRTLQTIGRKFGVVPFHSIVAAFTDGKVRDWNEAPIPTKDLQKEVGIVVPSSGEQWR